MLGHPVRLAVFLRLLERCPGGDCDPCACVGDLGAGLGVAPSTISHHIKELRVAGLIRCERSGQRIDCGINAEALEDLRTLLHTLAAPVDS